MITNIENITVKDTKEVGRLLEMGSRATSYIRSFAWCPEIQRVVLWFSIGDVLAIFRMDFVTKIGGTDNSLLVIVGDLPSVYIVTEPDETLHQALERYCSVMDDWICSVLTFGDANDVFPVHAERSIPNAKLLRLRLDFIRTQIIPKTPDYPMPK